MKGQSISLLTFSSKMQILLFKNSPKHELPIVQSCSIGRLMFNLELPDGVKSNGLDLTIANSDELWLVVDIQKIINKETTILFDPLRIKICFHASINKI